LLDSLLQENDDDYIVSVIRGVLGVQLDAAQRFTYSQNIPSILWTY